MTKVRAGAVVFATGVIEQPAVFRNNDLPGVLLGSAAQRLLHRYGIAPGKRVAILTANREGYELARELRAHGIDDRRRARSARGLRRRCVWPRRPALRGGRDSRGGALPARTARCAHCACAWPATTTRPGAAETIACDAVLMSVGFAPAAGLLAQAGAAAIRRGAAAAPAGQTTARRVRRGPRQWRL